MPTSAKKSSTKAPSRANGSAAKANTATHPTWVDMIKECIVDNPSDARSGVSRPMIKKFVENKYHIDVNPSTASQLNRAITSGSEKGIFFLPKGPSGKVKLAPKSRLDATKENTKPLVKKLPITKVKAKAPPAKAPVKKPLARVPARAPAKPKAPTAKAKTVKPPTLVKKIGISPRRAPAKKPAAAAAAATKKVAVPKKSVAVKKATTKRSTAKKAVIGEAKKPVSKLKATAAKKPTSKAKAKPVA